MRTDSIRTLVCILSLGFVFNSCNKTNSSTASSNTPPARSSQTIAMQLLAAPSFTLLRQAAEKSGVINNWQGAGPFTVFAPDDTAFGLLGIDSILISSLSASTLTTFLMYQTWNTQVAAAQLPAGPNAKMITASGDSVFVTNNSDGMFVNGRNLLTTDIPASNGVIHKILTPLLPSFGQNLVQLMAVDTTLSLMSALFVRASQGSTNLVNMLSNGGVYTINAPTNDAFRAAGYSNTAFINAANPDTLAKLLSYHVITGRVFFSDLLHGSQLSTLNGETVTTSHPTANNFTISGKSNPSASNFLFANRIATNGVLHKIDQVLLP